MKKTIAQEAKELLEPIPKRKWCTGYFDQGKKHCALGHCIDLRGAEFKTSLAKEVINYMKDKIEMGTGIISVNDGYVSTKHLYPQDNPKDRIIALLDDMIKAGY